MINLSNIVFPVYALESFKPMELDGILFYFNDNKELIVDDKKVPLDSLGKRRLYLKSQDTYKLYKLRHAIYFLADLIKITKASSWYIDSAGKTFEYKKSKIVPLIFRKIEKIIPIKTGGAIVQVCDIPQRFKCMYMPSFVEYAGLLQLSTKEYLLYGLYKEKHKDTRRKI